MVQYWTGPTLDVKIIKLICRADKSLTFLNLVKDSLSDNSLDSLVESDDSSQSLFDLTLEEKVSPILNRPSIQAQLSSTNVASSILFRILAGVSN